MKFRIEMLVNGEITCVLENLSKEQAYNDGIPGEAEWGSRWNVKPRPQALFKLHTLYLGESMCLAYQDEPTIPGLDVEEIYATKTSN